LPRDFPLQVSGSVSLAPAAGAGPEGKSARMQAVIINIFIDATLHVLATLGGVQFTVQQPRLKTDAASSGEVTGVIRLLGGVNGSVALGFERGCVVQIVSSMLGEDIRDLDLGQDIQDAVGEITNMVSGQAAQKLGDVTPRIEIRPDVVLMGQGAIPGQTRGAAVIAVPLIGPAGRLTIEFCWSE